MKVAVIDYNMGNLFSVQRALAYTGIDSVITGSRSEILKADGAVLPGVGAFGEALYNLKQDNLIPTILDFINSGRPFMGICLGMQLLFTKSYEFGCHEGLGIVRGNIVRFNNHAASGRKVKVPHVSWNQIERPRESSDTWESSLLADTRNGTFMYFVHSYYAEPEETKDILSVSAYGGREYCSAIKKENVEAFQFHPEKSGKDGLRILQRFKNKLNQVRKGFVNDEKT